MPSSKSNTTMPTNRTHRKQAKVSHKDAKHRAAHPSSLPTAPGTNKTKARQQKKLEAAAKAAEAQAKADKEEEMGFGELSLDREMPDESTRVRGGVVRLQWAGLAFETEEAKVKREKREREEMAEMVYAEMVEESERKMREMRG